MATNEPADAFLELLERIVGRLVALEKAVAHERDQRALVAALKAELAPRPAGTEPAIPPADSADVARGRAALRALRRARPGETADEARTRAAEAIRLQQELASRGQS
jgi:hypothetical protein